MNKKEQQTEEEKRRKINASKFTFLNLPDKFTKDYLTNTYTFANRPIKPEKLSKEVVKKLKQFNKNKDSKNQIPEKSTILVSELCKTFNQCIHLNQNNHTQEKLVLSPQTGSAKSLSAKVYVSLLRKESCLIVVQRVDSAIEFCRDINEWSNNKDYARCSYQISKDNPNNSLRVEKSELNESRCIIITHNMFKRANISGSISAFNYQNKKRDFVLIDERIQLHQKFTVHKKLLEEYLALDQIEALHLYNKNMNLYETLLEVHIMLKDLLNIFPELYQISKTNKTNILYSPTDADADYLRIELESICVNIAKNIKVIAENYIHFAHNPLMKKETSAFNKQSKEKLIRFLQAIKHIANNDFFYYRDGRDESISTVINIENLFGSCVELDATAKINMYSDILLSYGPKNTKYIKTTAPKIYNNLTIHTAKGYYQGKSSILKHAKNQDNTLEYIKLIESLLDGNTDKLLLITSKDFREVLETLTANERIRFTHWGDHIGKNNWNDCSRVMIIGWSFYKNVEYYSNFVSALGSLSDAHRIQWTEKQIRHRFKVTQVVDDLVQAANRSAIRNTIDTKGNCPQSHVYIFYANKKEYADVMDVFIEQFQGATVEPWTPNLKFSSKNLTTTEKRMRNILDFISMKLSTKEQVLLSTIVKEHEIPKSTLSRIMKRQEFKDLAIKKGIDTKELNKKSLAFIKLQSI